MIEAERFLTRSLSRSPIGMPVARILAAAIQAVDPYRAVNRHFVRTGNHLEIGQQVLELSNFQHIYIVGAGKASVPMAAAVYKHLSSLTKGTIITKDGYGNALDGDAFPSKLEILEASHPVPDSRGVEGTKKILALLEKSNDNDLVIFLLSGGASALLTSPADTISLEDLQQTTAVLLSSGATIQEVNCIRKHLDIVKGGQLARAAAPATSVALILSDVVGDSLEIIASGPTTPDSSTYQEALEILSRYRLMEEVPSNVIAHLEMGASGKLKETPKPGDPTLTKVHNIIIGNNIMAAEAAVLQARQEGFNSMLLTNFLQGEAYQVGKVIAAIARQLATREEPLAKPACVVLGGETTVTLTGQGLGGRNQELALGCVEILAGLDRTIVVSLATDGGDGPTDAAGAVVTGETYDNAQALGLHPTKFIQENDSYHFFEPLSDLIKTGPTQTNVTDLVLIFSY